MWCSSVTRLCWDLVSVSFSRVLILKPSASPVWLPCGGQEVSPPPTLRVWWEVGLRTALTYIVEEIPNSEDQVTEDWQPLAGEQACDGGAGLKEGPKTPGYPRPITAPGRKGGRGYMGLRTPSP